MKIVAIGQSLKVMGYGNYALQESLKVTIARFLGERRPSMVWILPIPGFGLYMADECRRQQYPYILVQPFRGHHKPWPLEIRKWYGLLQRSALRVINADRMVGYQDRYGKPDEFAKNKIMKATRYAAHQMAPYDILLTTRFPHRQEWSARAPDMVLDKNGAPTTWYHYVMTPNKHSPEDTITCLERKFYDDVPF